MTTDFKSIDEYMAQQPDSNKTILQKIRQTIKEMVPEAEETISYQMPAFKYFGVLVYFAGFKTTSDFMLYLPEMKRFKKN